jgi:hypothetical protein
MRLLNHGPELARQVDRKSGLLPIHARLDGFPAASDLMRLCTTTDGCGEHTQQSSGGDNVINVHRQISTCPSGASVAWASPLVCMLGA